MSTITRVWSRRRPCSPASRVLRIIRAGGPRTRLFLTDGIVVRCSSSVHRRFLHRPTPCGITMRGMSVMPTHVARLGMATTIAAICLAAVSAQLPADAPTRLVAGDGPTRVALYAGVGEELITFGVDVERATLTRQSSLMLPGFVQEAWASPGGTFLYVAWSNGGSSYTGSGVEPRGDRHGITAFRVDASGTASTARSASTAALASHPHDRRWTRTISARGVQRSERSVRSCDQRRRRRRCRGASTRLARCRYLRASGSRSALEPRGGPRHPRQRTDRIFSRGPWRSEGLPLRRRQAVG